MGTRKFWSQLTGAGPANKQQGEPVKSKTKHTNATSGDKSLNRTRPKLSTPVAKQADLVTPTKSSTSPSSMMSRLQLSRSSKKTKRSKLLSSKSFRPLINLNLQLTSAVRERILKASRRDGQAFIKLTNELATPPAKLYSPFNITDTPENRLGSSSQTADRKVTRRKLDNCLSTTSVSSAITDQSRSTKLSSDSSGFIDCSFDSISTATSPKERIALQHKKHLINANKFAFDSPTGKLRETVKDVERFQLCIEAISKAIESKQPK